MRVRPALLLSAVFGAALVLCVVVVRETVLETRRSAAAPADPAPAAGLAVLAADPARAERGTLSGRVRGGPTVEGAVVSATPAAGGIAARAAVSGDGTYALSLPPGDYRVVAVPAGADPADARALPSYARVSAGAATRADLALPPGAPAEAVTVAVVAPGGAPAAGAAVTLSRAGDRRAVVAGRAQGDGRLVLPGDLGLAGREVTVEATQGDRRGAWTGTLPAGGTVEVALDGRVERAPGAPAR
jgi:hypothetical protein